MTEIHLLDPATVEKIAAGEVIERPASVVKELLENALDAGATRVTVEIRDGGISLIRITDNGRGIPEEEIPLAFTRHATSKILSAEDLMSLSSLGFRGEALSSIAAVSRVELITKREEALSASRYLIEGGREKLLEEIGAPDGTTIAVRDIFFNTPARAKFLKTPMTEASHVGAVVEQLLLSHPEVAFTYIVNGQTKISSSGNGGLKNAVYRIYGREVTELLLPLSYKEEGIRISGFIGKPVLSRGNRSYENYYVNGRYLKSRLIGRAIEDGYGTMLMNHQYPFTCFMMEVEASAVDVNVHPTKMDVRFSDEKRIYEVIRRAVHDTLQGREMIVESPLNPKEKKEESVKPVVKPLQAFETSPEEADREGTGQPENGAVSTEPSVFAADLHQEEAEHGRQRFKEAEQDREHFKATEADRSVSADRTQGSEAVSSSYKSETGPGMLREDGAADVRDVLKSEGVRYEQQSFLPDFLSREAAPLRRIVGQVFDTYWICEFDGKMFLFDQHAAHEKVLFEQLMRRYEKRELLSQQLAPPLVVTLSAREEDLLAAYSEAFADLGFEVESFGERDYCIRAVPYTLGGLDSPERFRQLLDQLEVSGQMTDLSAYVRRIATEACKAAVKGGERISEAEASRLLTDLMSCEDPYHCPHGRPTIISFTKQDLEKRFKRII